MIIATATITLSELEARQLWEADEANRDLEDAPAPVGQELADWVAQFVCTTLESNWQYDAGVFADIKAGASTDTPHLLEELRQCEGLIGDGDSAAKERLDEIKEALGLSDDPEESHSEFEALLGAYTNCPVD